MSSNLEVAETVDSEHKNKKRKHEGSSKESRKKPRQLEAESTLDTNNEQEAQKSEIKKDRKKEKKQKQEETDLLESQETRSLVNGSSRSAARSWRKGTQEVNDLNAEERSRTSPPKSSRTYRDESVDMNGDSGVELLAGSGSVASEATSKRDTKKRKKERQIEQESIPHRSVPNLESSSKTQDVGNDIVMADALTEPANTGGPVVQYQKEDETSIEAHNMDTTSSFYSTRLSLYLSIPPIATANPLSGLLSLHLTPLLLTYFAPAGGVILSYHDPVLSTRPESGLNKSLVPPSGSEVPVEAYSGHFTKVGDEAGARWAWLTVTFLVFKPDQGDELKGWTNVMSEGFIGIVCYNYFQTAISKAHIPQNWTWTGASRPKAHSRKAFKKGKLNDIEDSTQEYEAEVEDTQNTRADDAMDGGVGTFVDENGSQMPESTTVRVVDLDIVPAADRGKWSLQIEGTLLNQDEEAKVREEERLKFEDRMDRNKSRSRPRYGTPMMSGGLQPQSRASSVMSIG